MKIDGIMMEVEGKDRRKDFVLIFNWRIKILLMTNLKFVS